MVKSILRQVLSAVSFLHRTGVCHRNITIDSVHMNEKGDVKLTDFSHCINYLAENPVTPCGSVEVMAPEMAANISMTSKSDDYNLDSLLYYGNVEYDTKADIWNIGALCYRLLYGVNISYKDPDSPMPIIPVTNFVTSDAINFMCACLNKCSLYRPDADTLLTSKWLLT